MPVKSIKKKGFAYIAYCRVNDKDYLDFKTELLSKAKENLDDIVVDVTKSGALNEAEIWVLIRVLQIFHGTKRTLRLIMSKSIYMKLEHTNFFKANNFVVYKSHKDFLADVNKVRTPDLP